jgi:signal peptidase I
VSRRAKVKKTLNSSFSFLWILLILFAARWTLIEPYVVPTGSMEPTLKTGDRLYALKCAYDVRIPFTNSILFRTGDVKRGDVILFDSPPNPEITYVKRAIGLPGDRLEFRNGALFINGEEMKKELWPDRRIMEDIDYSDRKQLFVEYLDTKRHYTILDTAMEPMKHRSPGEIFDGEITVPADSLFAVGDNRDGSADSRFWGFVPMNNLKGRAMFIWYSSWDDHPEIVESMRNTYPFDSGLVRLGKRIFGFVNEFVMFFPHLYTGDAWVRWERIGTPVY